LLAGGNLLFDVVHTDLEFIDQASAHDPLLSKLGGTPTPVPEPAAVMLMLAGLGMVVRKTWGSRRAV